MGSKVDEIIHCIAGTEHRGSILQAVSDDAKDLRDLSDELDIPRATLRHNLGKLIEADLVESTVTNSYRATLLGQAAIRGLNAFREPLATGTRLNPFLSRIDHTEFDVPLSAMEQAELTKSTRSNPFGPSHRVEDVLESRPITTCYLPILPSSLYAEDRETVPFEHVHFAAPPDILSGLADRNSAVAADLVERNRVFRATNPSTDSLGLLQTDTEAFVLVLDDNRKPDAFVADSSESFREWVDSQLGEIFSDISPIHDLEGFVTDGQQQQIK